MLFNIQKHPCGKIVGTVDAVSPEEALQKAKQKKMAEFPVVSFVNLDDEMHHLRKIQH